MAGTRQEEKIFVKIETEFLEVGKNFVFAFVVSKKKMFVNKGELLIDNFYTAVFNTLFKNHF